MSNSSKDFNEVRALEKARAIRYIDTDIIAKTPTPTRDVVRYQPDRVDELITCSMELRECYRAFDAMFREGFNYTDGSVVNQTRAIIDACHKLITNINEPC